MASLYTHYLESGQLRSSCNHYLSIESGRWRNEPRDTRLCNKCDLREIGDEFHYYFNCKSLIDIRKQCLSQKQMHFKNIITFRNIMNSNTQSSLRKLCSFIKKNINHTCSPT
jgi:hypothetical protein